MVKIRATSTPVPGGHYLEQPGATPSVYMTHHHTSSWRAIRQRMGRFISVYRLGEDGDLLKEDDGRLSVWALRACSYKTKAEV